MDFTNMTRAQLLQYLKDFVQAMEAYGRLSDEDMDFINIQKRVIWELSHDRIYKVSTAQYSPQSSAKYIEHDIKYFSSLKAAKKELRSRFKKLIKSPFVAGPDEVSDYRIISGVNPTLVSSVLSNSQVQFKAPGRFKFYEVRMITKKRQIVPVQFLLAEVRPVPLENPDDAKFSVSKLQKKATRYNVISFKEISKKHQ